MGATAIVVYYKDAEGNENTTEFPITLTGNGKEGGGGVTG